MNIINFRLYPTLLNHFDRFEKGYLTEPELLDRINRVLIPQTEAQARGTSFEDAVIKGENEDAFNAGIISRVRALLPRPMLKTQVYCEYQIEDVLLYGYVDVIGKLLAVDIKTTNKYEPGGYAKSHQNFYLPALKSRGIRTLRYAITDFQDVYQEDYDHHSDFTFQETQIRKFCVFLQEHRQDITDLKIFGK